MGVPLHVADAPNGLHLGATGPELVEVLEFALLQQVLVATVAGELVSHESARGGGKTKRRVNSKKTSRVNNVFVTLSKTFTALLLPTHSNCVKFLK